MSIGQVSASPVVLLDSMVVGVRTEPKQFTEVFKPEEMVYLTAESVVALVLTLVSWCATGEYVRELGPNQSVFDRHNCRSESAQGLQAGSLELVLRAPHSAGAL